MSSAVEICNRALQKLGAKRITSLTEDTKNARACNVAYGPCRLGELREHPWSFAMARATLAADAVAPDWGRANAFQLPTDFVCLRDPYPEDNHNDSDWVIEGLKVYTNDTAPLYIRYTKDVTDTNTMDALFREALACKMALEMCEEITQANTKYDRVEKAYDDTIARAKRANAIERISSETLEDTWITARL